MLLERAPTDTDPRDQGPAGHADRPARCRRRALYDRPGRRGADARTGRLGQHRSGERDRSRSAHRRSGDLALDHLDGPAKIDIRGSGNAIIAAGTLPSLAVEIRGSGDVKLGSGEIGTVTANIAGSGTVHIDGTVKDATLSTTGSGDIEIAKATGTVQQHKTGSGEIRIGK
ncbi:MAG: DUF2807 domain-containing protein [Aliidongia sp.]